MLRHLGMNNIAVSKVTDIIKTYQMASVFNGVEYISAELSDSLPGRAMYELRIRYATGVNGIDVLFAILCSAIKDLSVAHPEYELRWSETCHREIGAWFACTENTIYYNKAREEQYSRRVVTMPEKTVRGMCGEYKVDSFGGLQLFGEPNKVRKVYKAIVKECSLKEPFLDLRENSELMQMCGGDVIIICQANNGWYHLINDTIITAAPQIALGWTSPWVGALYSNLGNHKAFQ